MTDHIKGSYVPPKKHSNGTLARAAFVQTLVDNPYAIKPDNSRLATGASGAANSQARINTSNTLAGSANTNISNQERVHQRTSDNPLLTMLLRQRIDKAQFLAGQKYQNAHFISTGQTGQGIDYSRQRVDCSLRPTSLAERQLQASDLIGQANQALKLYGVNEKDTLEAVLRVQKIAGEGLNVTQYCRLVRGLKSSKSVSKQMNHLREDLNVLVTLWRLGE